MLCVRVCLLCLLFFIPHSPPLAYDRPMCNDRAILYTFFFFTDCIEIIDYNYVKTSCACAQINNVAYAHAHNLKGRMKTSYKCEGLCFRLAVRR